MDNLSEWAKPELIWFVIGLALLLIEFAMPGLIIFFFGIGAWVVSALCFFVDISINAQLIVFIVSSVLFLLVLRSRLKSLFSGFGSAKEDMSSDMPELIGETALVKETIKANIKGRVEIHGTNWDAVAEEEIEKGTSVVIVGKESITLKVKRI